MPYTKEDNESYRVVKDDIKEAFSCNVITKDEIDRINKAVDDCYFKHNKDTRNDLNDIIEKIYRV